MNVEEKAKAYDEALEIARQIHNGNPSSGTAIVVCEQIFPQLCESEDEKLRKLVIYRVRTATEMTEGLRELLLDYLEKQKDSLHVSGTCKENADSFTDKQKVCCLKCNEYEIGYKAGYEHGCTAGYNKAMKEVDEQKEPENTSASTMAPSCWEVEQKEQKELPLMSGDADLYFDEWNQQKQNPTKRQCFEEGIRYAQRLQKEQKPAECIEFANEFENQVSHLIASVLNGEHEYNEGFVKYVAQSLLEFAKKEQKPISQEDFDTAKQEATCGEHKPNYTEDMPYITDEHFYERAPADSFKYKLAEYMTKGCTKKEGPYGYTYAISAETILKMAEEELLKRGVVQKPAEWSEEDERRIDAICELLENTSAIHPNYSRRKLIIWLKSLRSQLKREVTDEEIEEMATKRARGSGTTKSEMAFYRNGIKDAIKRFGLRPSWKPSEEQMDALAYAIQILDDGISPKAAKAGEELEHLREQLKKL